MMGKKKSPGGAAPHKIAEAAIAKASAEPRYCKGCGVQLGTDPSELCASCQKKEWRASVGRPTLYNKDIHPNKVFEFALLGLTDAQMAGAFGINESTLQLWKRLHPEFIASLNEGRYDADGNVSRSLYERATGYTIKEDHPVKNEEGEVTGTVTSTKLIPPDVTAMIFWLKNRASKNWRERSITEIVGKDDGPVQHEVGTPTDYKALREKIAKQRKGE